MAGDYGGFIGSMNSDKQGHIYAGTKALFSSYDEGESWNKINDNFSPYSISNLIISDTVFFADFEWADCDDINGYSKISKDNGKTWVWDTSYDSDVNLYSALKFGNSYFRGSGNYLEKSTDEGKTWVIIDSTTPNYHHISNIILDKNGNLIYNFEYEKYLKTYNPNTNEIVELGFDSNNVRNIEKICIDSSNNYYLGLYFSYFNNDYIYISKDEGKSWKGAGFQYAVSDMIVTKDDKVFVSTDDDGIYFTNDHGNTWLKTPSLINSYLRFYQSPTGNLFAFGNYIYKYIQGKWLRKVEGIDADGIYNLGENNNLLFCSSYGNGINYFDKKTNKWENYFLDTNDNYNRINNFVISGNKIIAVNDRNVVISNLDSINWIKKPPLKELYAFCNYPSFFLLSSHYENICFSNAETQYSYVSNDTGNTWIDLSKMLDSSSVWSNLVDKNGFIFIAKSDNPGAPDSIKCPVIVSKDNGYTWEKINSKTGFSDYIYLAEDFSKNAILIDKNIFYKYNTATNSWDSIFTSIQEYNQLVLFISDSKFLTLVPRDYWPSTSQAIVIDMNSGTVDTIANDYNYIEINKFYRSDDGSVYAATDRGVFKLDISTGVETNVVNDNQLGIYPNPANEKIYINYKNDNQNPISLIILNQLGELIFEKNYNDYSKFNSLQISTKEYPSGIYYCILKTSKEFITQKFILVK
jgi:ligand-binding sensor domain-containing protein